MTNGGDHGGKSAQPLPASPASQPARPAGPTVPETKGVAGPVSNERR